MLITYQTSTQFYLALMGNKILLAIFTPSDI